MRTGLLLALIGAWLVTRSVVKDDQGHTLIDRILGFNPSKDSSSNDPTSTSGALTKGFNIATGVGANPLTTLGDTLTEGAHLIDEGGGGFDTNRNAIFRGSQIGAGRVAPHFAPGTSLQIPQLRRLFTLPPSPTSLNRTSRAG